MGSVSDITGMLNTSLESIDLRRILAAVGILLVCLLVSKLLLRIFARMLRHSHLEVRMQQYILAATRVVLYLVTGIMVASFLGIDTTSLLALLSVGSLGITLAAEDVLGNMAGGLVIVSSRPFALGDYIEADGVGGTVEKITLNHTQLKTAEGNIVMLPNKELAGSKVTNYTSNGQRRIAHSVKVPVSVPAKTVRTAMLAATDRVKNVKTDPAPVVHLSRYGDGWVEYTVKCWALTDAYWDVYFDLAEVLPVVLAEYAVPMAASQVNVRIMDEGHS